MIDGLLHLAFIGPGGPEFLLVLLVLLVMFGAKDAPRILRKLNEVVNHVRHTADNFKREVMYGDLYHETPADDAVEEHDEDYDYDAHFHAEEEGLNVAAEEETEPRSADDEGRDDRKD